MNDTQAGNRGLHSHIKYGKRAAVLDSLYFRWQKLERWINELTEQSGLAYREYMEEKNRLDAEYNRMIIKRIKAGETTEEILASLKADRGRT